MLKEVIATGETVELALEKAYEEIGMGVEDGVEFEIIEMPQKKTLGLFGGSPAKVRVYIEESNPSQEAKIYLMDILASLGFDDVDIEIEENEAGAALTIVGGDTGFIIGHRGETLDSLQYLASLVANQIGESYYRITLDVANYREKRKDTLESLGKKMAIKSVKTGRNNYLEPMNPYERRIIHTAVQEIEGAKSWSEGEDMNRHVVIGPEGGEKYQRRDNNRRGGSRGGYNNNRNRNSGGGQRRSNGGYNKPRSSNNATSAPTTAPKSDAPDMPIYGKIEKD